LGVKNDGRELLPILLPIKIFLSLKHFYLTCFVENVENFDLLICLSGSSPLFFKKKREKEEIEKQRERENGKFLKIIFT
jgi:hypothetical protein